MRLYDTISTKDQQFIRILAEVFTEKNLNTANSEKDLVHMINNEIIKRSTFEVSDHTLVGGVPARQMGWVCECGQRLNKKLQCPVCGRQYTTGENGLEEII